VEAGTSSTLVVEHELHIDASRETVFEFFTDPAKMVRWMGRQATLDPRPGGVYRVEMNEGAITVGEFVEVDPPSRLVLTWGWEGGFAGTPPGSSTVEVTFTEENGGTHVHLVHRGFGSEEATTAHDEGWTLGLGRLAIAATGGDPGPYPQRVQEG